MLSYQQRVDQRLADRAGWPFSHPDPLRGRDAVTRRLALLDREQRNANDEIDRLEQALDNMPDNLGSDVQELRETIDQLDNRIADLE